ncbi:MAG TPA: type II toxin-antitoxin system prevent-host-death family antitoxin, partial [Bryobacteraceae bacterium]
MYTLDMKVLSVSDFRRQCLQLLDNVPAEGILIVKHGQPMARVTPIPHSCSNLIGILKGLASDPKDDLLSTGVAWDAESGHS